MARQNSIGKKLARCSFGRPSRHAVQLALPLVLLAAVSGCGDGSSAEQAQGGTSDQQDHAHHSDHNTAAGEPADASEEAASSGQMVGHEHHGGHTPKRSGSGIASTGAADGVTAEGLEASGAYLRQPAPGQSVLAAFVTFHNSTDHEYLLTGVSSPRAQSVEVHRTFYEEGVMRMRAVQSLAVPPQGKLTFKPGGYHLMLAGVEGTLKPGDQLPLQFTFGSESIDGDSFEGSATLSVTAEVRPLR